MVEQLMKEYQLQSECTTSKSTYDLNSVRIEEGSIEGYFIIIVYDDIEYTIRQHDYNEALKILGVMLKVINPNK